MGKILVILMQNAATMVIRMAAHACAIHRHLLWVSRDMLARSVRSVRHLLLGVIVDACNFDRESDLILLASDPY